MKKIILSAIAILSLITTSSAQYWQQGVDYTMDIDMNVETNQFSGTQHLVYSNNSNDTLKRVYYHLYFNAFQPNSMMDVRSRNIKDPDARVGDRIEALKPDEIGYQNIISLKQNNKAVNFTVEGTILQVELNEPILPQSTVEFDMVFNAQVPLQVRRSGRDSKEGVKYSMTQWFPKMAEYDKEGWHPFPYIGREFHAVWGNFDVTLHIDANYTVAATGVLQNPSEIGHGYIPQEEVTAKQENGKLAWHFKADMVHDFSWAADTNYIHDQITISNGTVLHFFYLDNEKNIEMWKAMQPFAVQTFEIANVKYGEYPYPLYSIVQGGDGGMEYAMMTLITASRDLNGLINVMVHETMHSWYQGVLATNESKYPWMDEGFTSYAEHMIVENYKPEQALNPLAGSYRGVYYMLNSDDNEPLSTYADWYHSNQNHGISAYSKGSVFVHQLGYVVGQENLDDILLAYFDEWKFKHPTPNDFKRVAEEVSGMELDWYFNQYIYSMNTIDYSITNVEKVKKETTISFEKIGDFPMPLDITVTLKDSTILNYNIPLFIMRGNKTEDSYFTNFTTLDDWAWVNPKHEITIPVKYKDIISVEIDPSTRLLDVNKENNIFVIE